MNMKLTLCLVAAKSAKVMRPGGQIIRRTGSGPGREGLFQMIDPVRTPAIRRRATMGPNTVDKKRGGRSRL